MDEATIERIAERVADELFEPPHECAVTGRIMTAIREVVGESPTPTGRTIDVRVPLIVGSDGVWSATGGSGWSEKEVLRNLVERFGDTDIRYHILTATVELPPDASEVQAGVEGVEQRDNTIDDGFGGEWVLCGPDCSLAVMRPGKVQCDEDGKNCPMREDTPDE